MSQTCVDGAVRSTQKLHRWLLCFSVYIPLQFVLCHECRTYNSAFISDGDNCQSNWCGCVGRNCIWKLDRHWNIFMYFSDFYGLFALWAFCLFKPKVILSEALSYVTRSSPVVCRRCHCCYYFPLRRGCCWFLLLFQMQHLQRSAAARPLCLTVPSNSPDPSSSPPSSLSLPFMQVNDFIQLSDFVRTDGGQKGLKLSLARERENKKE